MARQVGDVLFCGTSGWANGYVGPDGRGVVRWKSPGMTGRELRDGTSELRRIWTGRFGCASRMVMDWWRWVPEGLRELGDRYASQRMVGMLMPVAGRDLPVAAGVLSGMNLSGDAVADADWWVDVVGEDRDFYARSCKLPEGFVVRGMEGLEDALPGIRAGKLRVRVHVHVGTLGMQVAYGEDRGLLPQVDYRHVTEWVELEDVEALCRVGLDWKKILRGRKVGDVVVLLGVEVGHVWGSRVVRLRCASRLWVAWAGALEKVPRRRVNRGVRRGSRRKDRGALRGLEVVLRVVEGARDGP